MSLLGRSGGIGVAVGPGVLTGSVDGSATRPERVEVHPAPEDAGAGAWLESAFLELASRLETTHGRSFGGAEVNVALLPPLADVRLLTLPPLTADELEAVVRRDAARHFMGMEGLRVVAVESRRRAKSGPAPVLAAAATASFLEGVRRAVASAGWRLASVVPAHAAWLAAGLRGRKAGGLVVAVEGETAHVLRLAEGAPVSLRRVPLGLRGGLAEATGQGRGPAVLFGERPELEAVTEVVREGGWILPPGGQDRPTAAEAAARHAGDVRLELVPPSLAAERADRARGNIVRMGVVAAVLVVVAGLVHLWGQNRALESIQARRAEIRDEVAPIAAARDSLDALNARMATIDEITGRSPRWTRALYELAMLLPRDAHLTSLVASDGSLEIEAEASRAGVAIQALRGARNLRNVELLGLVERQLEEGETVVERFRLAAELAPPGDLPGVDPGTTGAGAPGVGGSGDGASGAPTSGGAG